MLKLDCDTEVHFTFRGANERKQVKGTLNELQIRKSLSRLSDPHQTNVHFLYLVLDKDEI